MSSDLFKKLEASIFGIPSQTSAGGGAAPGTVPLIGLSAVREPKWNGRWRRLLRLGANVATAAFGPVGVPSVVLNRFGDDDYYPDEQLYAHHAAIGSGVGTTACVGVVNPPGSGVLSVIYDAEVARNGTTGFITVRNNSPNAIALVLGAAATPVDLRIGNQTSIVVGPTPTVAGAVATAAAIAIGTQIWVGVSGDGQPTVKLPTIILPPGTSFFAHPSLTVAGDADDNAAIFLVYKQRDLVLPPA